MDTGNPGALMLIPIGLLLFLAGLVLGWVGAKKCTLPRSISGWLNKVGLGNDLPVSSEDFAELVEDAEPEEIAQDQKEMISGVLELDDITAGEIMTHRVDMVAVEESMCCRAVVGIALESGNSRLPIYHKTNDTVTGILYVKDLLCLFDRPDQAERPVREFARPVLFVPQSRPARQLLCDFRAQRCQVAIVVDEYGGTAGLVSMEDVLEEIVGDIRDEYDDEPGLPVPDAQGVLDCEGTLWLEEIFEAFGLEMPALAQEDEFDSAAGLLAERLGHLPALGEHVDWGGLRFTCRELGDHCIDRVTVERAAPQEDTP